MNSTGMFACTLAAVGVFIVCRYGLNLPRNFTVGMPLLAGVIGGVIGSLLTRPPDKARTDAFFRKIHTPIGEEHKLELPLDEAVPKAQRLLDTGGFFVVKPTRQDWVGFVVFLGACVACVFIMLGLLAL
jgi:hypothetical protein